MKKKTLQKQSKNEQISLEQMILIQNHLHLTKRKN